MKSIRLLGIVYALAVSLFAKTGDVVDSMVYDKGMEWRVYAGGGPVNAFAVDGIYVWMAVGDKVVKLNTKNGQIEPFVQLGSLPGKNVVAMTTDASGSVWAGGEGGVAVAKAGAFTNYTQDNGLGSNTVKCICATPDAAVWVGTDKGACMFRGGAWTPYTAEKGLSGDDVRSIVGDKQGGVWFATNRGVSVFKQGSWTSHTSKTGLSSNDVKALGYDAKKNRIWAAAGQADINSFDGSKWNVFMDIQEGIASIMVDTQSRVWFGFVTGLIKFNGDEWVTEPKKIGVPAVGVTQMVCDRNGNLWFGAQNGVIFLNNPYPF